MRISRGYIFIFLVAFANQVLGQTRFNKVIETSTADGGLYIQQKGSFYEVISAQGDGTGTFAHKFYRLDSLGIVEDSVLLASGDRMAGAAYYINGRYVLSGFKDSIQGANRAKPYFVYLDENGDSLWTYHDTQALGIGRFYEAIYDGVNGVYVCGYIDPDGINQTYKGILIKFDTTGNLLWRNVYSSAGVERFVEAKFHDDHIYLSGSSSSGPYGSYDVLLAKMDSSGNKLWCNYWGGSYVDYSSGLNIVNDSTIQIFGAKVNGVDDASLYLIRTDTSGNTVWEYVKYFNFWDDDIVIDFKELPNTDMIVFASHVDPDFNDKQVAMIIKLDSSRNILWTRKYNIRPTHHYMFGFDETSDGGFVFTGSVGAVIGTYQDTWVVKVDSMGCDVPLCYLGESELGQTVPILKVYPNPTDSKSILDLTGNEREIHIFNTSGKLIRKQKLENNQKSFLMNFDLDPKGIYILKIFDSQGLLVGQSKVLKN